ncbi:hypothetical protein ACH79_04140 [Bradyrhizobium sp. CCBAU 051011]|nr:hypothetical protein ACH79_04140 [Bradyrhizobium sp. CCBAU 051011]
MPFENPAQNDGSRGHPISRGLRRALVFVLLGPVFGVFAALLVAAVAAGGAPVDIYPIHIVFFFSLIICATTGPIDGVLAYIVPISLRVPLTTIVGGGRCRRTKPLFVGSTGEQGGATAAVLADSDRNHRGTLRWCLLLALAQSSQPTGLIRQASAVPASIIFDAAAQDIVYLRTT